MKLVVNGAAQDIDTSRDRTLLAVLRDELGLRGAKLGCGEGECGACTVLVDGEIARACTVKIAEVASREVTTIEGIASRDSAKSDGLHRVQRTFLDENALQCGFCTPGMIVASVALLEHQAHPSEDDIARALERNVCRCGCQPRIVTAVRRAADARSR
jgi:aerobic-type carbon monoxide dehydrogenase small subunit (CoxS/CutS family)